MAELQYLPGWRMIMRKARIAAVIVLAVSMLFGCKAEVSPFPPEQSAIFVSKAGEIYSAIVETYDASKTYYDAAELKTLAEAEAAAYNQQYPVVSGGVGEGETSAVALSSCTLENGVAKVIYQYADGKSLCRFTKQVQDEKNHAEALSVSTVAEGLLAGKVTDGTWFNVKKGTAAAVEEVMKQSRLSLISVEGTVTVQTEGPILYYSGDVILKDAYTADISDGNAYLVFK